MSASAYIKDSLKRVYAVLKNPTYNGLAQTAHFAVSSTLVLSARIIGVHIGLPWLWIPVAALVAVWAAWKEFWFDPKNERPEVSGGTLGDILDFGFYLAGVGYAVALIVNT